MITLEQVKNMPRAAVDAALYSYLKEFPKDVVTDGDTHVEVFCAEQVGKILPARHLIAYCEPAALAGVTASLRKLCESRGWEIIGELAIRPDDGAGQEQA